jgi:hypothetical protein
MAAEPGTVSLLTNPLSPAGGDMHQYPQLIFPELKEKKKRLNLCPSFSAPFYVGL